MVIRKKYALYAPAGNGDPAAVGGPGDGDPAATEPPEPAAGSKPADKPVEGTVKIGDKEFKVGAGLAAALNAFQADMATQLTAARAAAQVQAAPAQAPQTKADEAYDYATGIFTEPDVALARLREEIKTEIRTEYHAEKNQEKFWNTFYKDNKDLKDMDIVVEAVLHKNYASLKSMETEQASKELARLTREAVQVFTKPKKQGDRRDVVEGASHGVEEHSAPVQEDKGGVTSLSDVIRNRQAAKRKAASS